MQVAGIRKELETLRKEHAPNFKTIEELLKTKKEDIHSLSDSELFRIIQLYHPELKTESDLTDEILEGIMKGEYP